ncbi:MAG: hypothetical protein CEE42_08600 [Promethearchaeota archaeon Loki_b31]|nr:MAG: hypothetical protein CEE42_08600 [Candidatus Lokiarchaeota archaeon Loki_b31]
MNKFSLPNFYRHMQILKYLYFCGYILINYDFIFPCICIWIIEKTIIIWKQREKSKLTYI